MCPLPLALGASSLINISFKTSQYFMESTYPKEVPKAFGLEVATCPRSSFQIALNSKNYFYAHYVFAAPKTLFCFVSSDHFISLQSKFQ